MIYTKIFVRPLLSILFLSGLVIPFINQASAQSGQIQITNLTESQLTESSIRIEWTTKLGNTNILATSEVAWGVYPNISGLGSNHIRCNGSDGQSQFEMTSNHCIDITGLSGGRHYGYRVTSTNATVGGDGQQSGDFNTPDNTQPTVNLTIPANGATVSGTAQASATASDTGSGINRVEFKLGDSPLGTVASEPYNINWDTTSFTDGTYTIKAVAYDNANNQNTSSRSITISNPVGGQSQPDTQSPTAPSNLSGTPLQSSVSLSWTGSTDNTGVAGYKVQRGNALSQNFVEVGNVSSLNFTNSGLNASTTYTYRVQAYDAAGNHSNFSNTIIVTTLAQQAGGSENQAPSIPQNVSTEVLSSSSIKISWNASTDPEGSTVSYTIYRGTTEIASGYTATNYTDAGLASATTYTYKVRAKDIAGNLSGFSSEVSATTSSGTAPPPPPGTPPPPPPPAQQVLNKTLIGNVVFSNGAPATGAVVKATNSSGTTYTTTVSNNGGYSMSVSSGTWSVNISPSSSSVNWSESETRKQVITFSGDVAQQLSANFTIIVLEANVQIRGTVKFSTGGNASGAQVYAWTRVGERNEATTDANGAFTINVTKNSEWLVRVGKMDGVNAYDSNTLSFKTNSFSISGVEVTLTKRDRVLANPVTVQKNVTEEVSITLSDGAKISIPQSSITASGNINTTVTPTIDVPPPPTDRIIGSAYKIEVKDQANVGINTFTKDIQIVFPYDDTELASFRISAQNLAPAYYNEATKTWVRITNFTLDTVNKRIIANINHLTRFALIAAADITPPSAPTNVSGARAGTSVVITWANPLSDFRHAKVYRSDQLGVLGSVLFNEVVGISVTDTTAIPGKTYYYVVRAVDPAGNESTNTEQALVVSTGALSSAFGQTVSSFARNLKIGLVGEDVRLLQRILNRDGITVAVSGAGSAGLETTYFGSLTTSAVIRFQEKYSSEVLAPHGLTRGTGYVGTTTRAKLSELKAKYSL